MDAGRSAERPLLYPGEQKRSRGRGHDAPKSVPETASRELGDWLLRGICLGWEEEFKHARGFLASDALDGDVSWRWITGEAGQDLWPKLFPQAVAPRHQVQGQYCREKGG